MTLAWWKKEEGLGTRLQRDRQVQNLITVKVTGKTWCDKAIEWKEPHDTYSVHRGCVKVHNIDKGKPEVQMKASSDIQMKYTNKLKAMLYNIKQG